VDDTRDVTQNGKTNVDEQISAASSLQEDTQRREDDGKDDLADVAVVHVSIAIIWHSEYSDCDRASQAAVWLQLWEILTKR